jgi:multimeric flavodoxin WrbA
MAMKALIIVGSRDPKGRTARSAEAVLEGLKSQGASGEVIFLTQQKIERCRQCDVDGWGICRAEGRCVIQDDFVAVVDRLRSAGAVVFANPVYFSDLSESMRAFLDRLRRICRNDAGKKGLAGKCAIGICVAGGGGGGAPACTVSMEKVLGNCGFDVVDLIPLRRQNFEMKLDVLKTTGRWLAACPSSQQQ